MSKIPAKTIITAHNNADFDALAAMVAAAKLYPDAVLVFPGSQEKTLRDFFIQSATYIFNFRNARDIDPDSVETVVLVDTRQRSRVSHIQRILENKNLTIHAYDHHPDTEEDIPYSYGIVKDVGATTSILVAEMQKKNILPTKDEATIFGLGIYEDTGSFTFNSTTQEDFNAAAWLIQHNMELNVIADLLNRELNAEQITLLNTLLESASTHVINGVHVVLAEISLDHYFGDFALLVHKMLDMENIRVLFALGRMSDRIHIVARSRTPNVDVGQICTSLGGGGHPYAASATVKDRTMSQVKDELFALLYSHINPQLLVKDVMSKPVIKVDSRNTIAEALEIMARYGFKALPIVEPDTEQCTGIIEHIIADKALAHGLGDISVTEYMMRECSIINPESDLYPIMETIVGKRQPLVPVVNDGCIVGVITRTDIINTFIEEPARIPETLLPEKHPERNIVSLLKERLPASVVALLTQVGELATQLGYSVYIVGGFVRDILLRHDNLDIDLVVEGDGIHFARKFAEKLSGRVRSHSKFQTAVIIYDDDKRLDVATARLEYYEHPAALPTIELSSIKMDLSRRDFTINALAVELNPKRFGNLVDFFGGRRDIKDKVLRVLHSLSFVEDPTRILRAVRFEQRFGFRIGKQTERLIKNALQLKLIDKLSGNRIFNELKLILEERSVAANLLRMQDYKLLEAIHPLLALRGTKVHVIEEIEKVLNWYRLLFLESKPQKWAVYLFGLCRGGKYNDVKTLTKRLNFPKKRSKDFLMQRVMIDEAGHKLRRWITSDKSNSRLYFILDPLPLEGVLYMMADTPSEDVRKSISLYLTKLKKIDIDITGDDLINKGVEPGPIIGAILRDVLAAKLDGLAETKQQQLAVAQRSALQNNIVFQT